MSFDFGIIIPPPPFHFTVTEIWRTMRREGEREVRERALMFLFVQHIAAFVDVL